MTDWAHGQGAHSFEYGKIDPEVIVEQGNFVQQWTIKFREEIRQQYGIVKVRFAPGGQLGELIEFDVELNAVPAELDVQGKDVTVNWRMYDGFEANGTFWTDSNGLEMQERHLHFRDSQRANHIQNISSNYYPVQGGIAIRDAVNHSNKEVVIMNDRLQGGSADLTKSTIELMQNRVILEKDVHGLDEPLIEKDSSGYGVKVNARYYMQIHLRSESQS